MLILLLYCANDDCKDLYLIRSDKDQIKPRVYNIKVLKKLFGNDVCTDLLFAHAFTGCDTTSRVFGIGKKTVINKIFNRSPKLQSCSQTFCAPSMTQVSIQEAGCKALACLFSDTGSNLKCLLCIILSSKVAMAKSFVKPERLQPKRSAKFHALRTYSQVMQWMGKDTGLNETKWGWKMKDGKFVPVMIDQDPAPEVLLKMIRCNCSTRCMYNNEV